MPIPKPNYNPPFNVTRASHAVLYVKDLAKSRAFYVDPIGFIVSDGITTRYTCAAGRGHCQTDGLKCSL